MAREEEKLQLGKGLAFVKSRLGRLPQSEDNWEADFQALPKPIMPSETHYLGLVVSRANGALLADLRVEGRPTVNDLATLLAHAMRHPLDESKARRPQAVHLRRHPQWKELFSHLRELGTEVVVQAELPAAYQAYESYLRRLREARSVGKVKPSIEQAKVEKFFPAIARWVNGYGHIEIGDQEMFGFVVRALDYGGLVFEDDKSATLVQAMAVLEKGLAAWFQEQGIDLA